MNVLNRLIMLLIALLLVVVPVLLLLVAFGALSADLVNQYTNYRGGLEWLGGVLDFQFDQTTRYIIAAACALVAILALILLLRELSFGRRVARDAVVEDTPGRETLITSGAVKQLIEHAARDAGAVSPDVALASEDGSYEVACKIWVPEGGSFSGLATGTKENIQRSLERYNVSYKEIEVTAQGTAS